MTAAHELAAGGVRDVVVLEADDQVGGLARSVNFKGNRIDIGGHRFFSKSDWVMQWWLDRLPLANPAGEIAYQGARREVARKPAASEADDNVMLVRERLSRIYFDGKFFDYPLKADFATARKLGWLRCVAFGMSYVYAKVFPRRPERNLADFFVNRFGERLYRQFFKDYTEKVWGRPCEEISAQWGAQRVKSLSIATALRHALLKLLGREPRAAQTSLIERFLYPKTGPGLMWEVTAARLQEQGIRILFKSPVTRIEHEDGRAKAVVAAGQRYEADAVISTMAVRDLAAALSPAPPADVRDIASRLEYRDFVIVGLLYRRLAQPVPDNWIYVQEPGVRVGRLQFFNNWSPYLVRDPGTAWVGMEYFCSQGDDLWSMPDEALMRLATAEMQKLRLADAAERLDAVVIRMPKAYPGYFGGYEQFDALRAWLDGLANLYLVGRNGMHRYNNQDHSMLSAKRAVEAILAGSSDKSAIWAVNIDDEYHEERK